MRIPIILKVFSILPRASLFAVAQPVINPWGVVNAASNSPGALPNSGVAQGSIFLVNGSNLGADNQTPLDLLQTTIFPLPTSQGLNGTTVQVTSGGVSTYAILLYESATQVAAILPSKTPIGPASVTVTYNGQTSGPAPIQVVQRAFSIFTRNGSGSGPGDILNLTSNTTSVGNRVTHSAQPGQSAVLVGTGLGPVLGEETQQTVSGNQLQLLTLQVFVGGQAGIVRPNVDYAGRDVGAAGVDEIQFQVPSGVEGCYVPVTVVLNGAVSNTTTMSISSKGDVCSEQNVGLSSADLQQMVNNNSARVGTITLTRLNTTASAGGQTQRSQNDTASASFLNMTPNQFVGAPGALPSPGGCVVAAANGALPTVALAGVPMDAGPALNVNGPTGAQQLTQSSDGSSYSGQFGGAYLESGAYETDDGGGGNDVGSFQANLNTPATFTWTVQNPGGAIPRTIPYLITWRGGDPNSVVLIAGLSAEPANNVGVAFECAERNSMGNFTVPAYILSWLPVNAAPIGVLSVSDVAQSKFSAPGLDAGYFTYMTGYAINVQYTAAANAKF
jgi:uncharacterized protein (TIGR03437 family)